MNSMNRTVTPSSRANMPNGMIWSSLKPRIRTQFTLSGQSPARRRRANPGQHLVVPSGHARDAREAVGVHRVHGNGDAGQAGILERLCEIGQQMPVRGEGDIERLGVRAEFRQVAHKLHDAFAQQRLSAGETDFGDPQADQHARHAQVVVERQVPVERAFISRAAVDTLVVATIRDGDAQIGDGAPEFVVKSSH